MPDRRDDRHLARRHGAHEPLVAEGEEVLEAAAAAGEHDHVGAAPAEVADCGRDRGRRARALDIRLGYQQPGGREACRDRGDHVLLRGRVVSGDEPDAARESRELSLSARVEEPFGCELLFQPFERGKVVAEAEALDR